MTAVLHARASGVAGPPAGGAIPVSRVRRLAIMAGLMLGVSLAALDLTIVATSVRTIADDLGGLDMQAWATTAYLITSAITTPMYGKLSDIYGRKPLFLIAISVFVTGSLACTLADSMYQLAAFRAVQGLGAGGLFSLSMTIVGDVVPPRERARYSGYLISVYGLFGVLGPLAGGLLAATPEIAGITGWRWVFLINVPIGGLALAVVATGLNLPRTGAAHRRVDWRGATALALCLVPLLIVADEGRRWGWASFESVLCYGVGAAGLVAFLLVERSMGEDALLPLRLFGNPTFRFASAAGVAVGFAMFGVITVLPLYLQVVGGASPTEAGLLMLPLVVGIVATSSLSGKLIERTGRYRLWPRLGSGLMIVGLLWFSTIGADTPFWSTALGMVVFGVGLGGNLQPLTLAAQFALPAREVGVATASATFFRQLGGSAGAAVFLTILFSTVTDRISDAFREAAGSPTFRAALADPAVLAEPANRAVVDALRSGDAGVAAALLEDSSVLSRLHPEIARPFLVGFAESTSLVFSVGAVVMVLALLATLAIKDDPLRTAPGVEPGVGPVAPGHRAPVVPHPASPTFRRLARRAAAPPSPEPPTTAVRRPAAPPVPQLPTPAAELLAGVPLLAGLPASALESFGRTAAPGYLPAGARLFEQGEPGDTLFVVRSGRVEMLVDGEVVREYGPGEVFGELALLSGGVRTATARARRDTELLTLRRADFDRLLATEPAFARALVGRLAARVVRPAAPPEAAGAVLVLVPAHAAVPPDTMRHLAGLVARELGRVGPAASLVVDDDPSRWAARLATAEASHDRVLLVATHPEDPWTRFCLRVADRVLAVIDPSKGAPASPLPPGGQLVALGTAGLGRWLDALTPAAHHLVDLAAPRPDVARLARRVTGRSLGLVLSGGGARGLAHVGGSMS